MFVITFKPFERRATPSPRATDDTLDIRTPLAAV
jgi:hypothetical protein